MTVTRHDRIIVGRVRKAFGLKGELLVTPITTEPGEVFAPGRCVFASGVGAQTATGARPAGPRPADEPCRIERSRPFKDAWLVKLDGVADKAAADAWRGVVLSAASGDLRPPEANEVYLHELAGMAVRDATRGDLGIVESWYELPQGLVLEVRGPAWRADVPFNEAFVTTVDRVRREIVVRLPEGMAEEAVER